MWRMPAAPVRINAWSNEELRQLRTLAAEGAPLAEIAATLGRTESAVRNKAVLHGVSLRRRTRPYSAISG